MDKKRYCKPYATEKQSTWESVAKDIGTLLMALDRINSNKIESGAIVQECQAMIYRIKDTLMAEGWEILYGVRPESNKPYYIITPPEDRS